MCIKKEITMTQKTDYRLPLLQVMDACLDEAAGLPREKGIQLLFGMSARGTFASLEDIQRDKNILNQLGTDYDIDGAVAHIEKAMSARL